MERIFDITMFAPLGHRHGTLRLNRSGPAVSGTIHILGGDAPFAGRVSDSGQVEFSGKMTTLLRSFTYIARGEIRGKTISLEVTGGRYHFNITGTEHDPCDSNKAAPPQAEQKQETRS